MFFETRCIHIIKYISPAKTHNFSIFVFVLENHDCQKLGFVAEIIPLQDAIFLIGVF